MTQQPQVNATVVAVVRLLSSWALRLASVGFGVAIEYKQVYGVAQAQWALVFLGLWFIGVPPALWFDGVWRLARIAQQLDTAPPAPTGPQAPGVSTPPPAPPHERRPS